MSTAYLPPVSWVEAAAKADEVIIEVYETYPKQTYRNRCDIITANGPISLSIPVNKMSGKKTKLKDIEIFYGENWQRLHWRTIDAAYSNSPFYLFYKDEFQPLFAKQTRFLLDFNMELCEMIYNLLELPFDFMLSEEFVHNAEKISDLRTAFSPKNKERKQKQKPYHQVFQERHGFIPDLSIIDLLFNQGPAAKSYLDI